MKTKFPIQFLLFSLALFSSSVEARSENYYFVTLEYPPLEYSGKSGAPKGVAVEIVTLVMKELGHSVSIRIFPWTRAVKMVRHGHADAIFTIFRNDEREIFLDYSEEILVPQPVFLYATKDSPYVYEGLLENIKEQKIGVVSTISYGQIFDRARPNLFVESTAALEQNFAKLLHGRIDLVVSNDYSANNVIKKLKIENNIKRLYPPIENVPSYIAFSKKNKLKALQKSFDIKLRDLKEKGIYNKMLFESGLNIVANDQNISRSQKNK